MPDESSAGASLRDALLALAAADRALRDRLARSGALFHGYHPEMAALHRTNAARLRSLLDAHGWPQTARDGADAVEAAWLVVQHAIGEPDFQRRMLALLQGEAARGNVEPAMVAMLDDRIRVFEGRPQRWGTQLDWDERGELSPVAPLEDPAQLDARRAAVGLGPLAGHVARLRERARAEGERPPADPAARRAEAEAWARAVGWRAVGDDDWSDVPVFGEPPSDEPAVRRPSAYVVLVDERGRVAIVHTDEGHDHLPGGGLEPGESWHEAILREVREECGFEVELRAWSCRAVDFVHSESERTTFEKLSLFVEARLRGPAAAGGAPEHALSWLEPIEAAARLTHPSQGWAVEQWLASRSSDPPPG